MQAAQPLREGGDDCSFPTSADAVRLQLCQATSFYSSPLPLIKATAEASQAPALATHW